MALLLLGVCATSAQADPANLPPSSITLPWFVGGQSVWSGIPTSSSAAVSPSSIGDNNPADANFVYVPIVIPAGQNLNYSIGASTGLTPGLSFNTYNRYQDVTADLVFPANTGTDPSWQSFFVVTVSDLFETSHSAAEPSELGEVVGSDPGQPDNAQIPGTVYPVALPLTSSNIGASYPVTTSNDQNLPPASADVGAGNQNVLNLVLVVHYPILNYPPSPADGQTLYMSQPVLTDPMPITATWDPAQNNTGAGPVTGSGTWSAFGDGYWQNALMPEYSGDTANFTGGITQASTVTLDATYAMGTINFQNANAYTIQAQSGDSLDLDNTINSASAQINVIYDGASAGTTHDIAAPITLDSNLVITVDSDAPHGDALAISGNMTQSEPGTSLTVAGNGTVSLSGTNAYSGGTTVNSGATLSFTATGALPTGGSLANNGTVNILAGTGSAATVSGKITGSGSLAIGASAGPAALQLAAGSGRSVQSSLTLSAGSTLDLTNNSLVINYGSGPSPLATIRSAIVSGFNNGAWNGTGIISSTAATHSSFALGYADGSKDSGTTAQSGQVLIRYTLIGDANLDGTVNLTDLLALLNSYGQNGRDWSEGDFNYDGTVNLTDLLALLNNYGQSTTQGASVQSLSSTRSVPEPATATLLAMAGAGLIARRRTRTTAA